MKFNDAPNEHLVDKLPEVFTRLDTSKNEHYEACNYIVGYTHNGTDEHKYLLMEVTNKWGRTENLYVACRLFYSRPNKSQGYGIGINGTDPPIFFKFSDCVHTYNQQNLGRCYNAYTCTKCGDSFAVDSSD